MVKSTLDNWNISEEQLFKDAFQNYQITFAKLSTALGIEDNLPVWILSNDKAYLGAAAIFYPGLLEDIRNTLNDDYYIIPSSIHEVLIVSESSSITTEALKMITGEVNKTLDAKDILSNNIYHYDLKNGFTEVK